MTRKEANEITSRRHGTVRLPGLRPAPQCGNADAMSRNLAAAATPRPRRRRLRAAGALVAVAALLLALVTVLALDLAPRARGGAAPDAAVARHALAAGQTLRAFLGADAPPGRLELSAAEIDALLASASRLAPGALGGASVEADRIALELSLGPPWLPLGLWANLGLDIAAPADGLHVAAARVGALPLPPALVEAGLVRALDRALGGHGLGRAALDGVTGIAVEDDAAVVEFGLGAGDRAALLAQLREAMRMPAGEAALDAIRRHIHSLQMELADGSLPRDGSVLPYLRSMIGRAAAMSQRQTAPEDSVIAGAGLLALAIYCGEEALAPAIGILYTEEMRAGNGCEGATLGGRDDLKRHFLVSAGLQAASTGSAALGIGELKELLDSDGGSGFSFDDMAANIAGARFAAAFLAAPSQEWPALAAAIGAESDVLPEVGDLPSGMSQAEFEARFGAVDSEDYRAMIAEIERRVGALPAQRALAGG